MRAWSVALAALCLVAGCKEDRASGPAPGHPPESRAAPGSKGSGSTRLDRRVVEVELWMKKIAGWPPRGPVRGLPRPKSCRGVDALRHVWRAGLQPLAGLSGEGVDRLVPSMWPEGRAPEAVAPLLEGAAALERALREQAGCPMGAFLLAPGDGSSVVLLLPRLLRAAKVLVGRARRAPAGLRTEALARVAVLGADSARGAPLIGGVAARGIWRMLLHEIWADPAAYMASPSARKRMAERLSSALDAAPPVADLYEVEVVGTLAGLLHAARGRPSLAGWSAWMPDGMRAELSVADPAALSLGVDVYLRRARRELAKLREASTPARALQILDAIAREAREAAAGKVPLLRQLLDSSTWIRHARGYVEAKLRLQATAAALGSTDRACELEEGKEHRIEAGGMQVVWRRGPEGLAMEVRAPGGAEPVDGRTAPRAALCSP